MSSGKEEESPGVFGSVLKTVTGTYGYAKDAVVGKTPEAPKDKTVAEKAIETKDFVVEKAIEAKDFTVLKATEGKDFAATKVGEFSVAAQATGKKGMDMLPGTGAGNKEGAK